MYSLLISTKEQGNIALESALKKVHASMVEDGYNALLTGTQYRPGLVLNKPAAGIPDDAFMEKAYKALQGKGDDSTLTSFKGRPALYLNQSIPLKGTDVNTAEKKLSGLIAVASSRSGSAKLTVVPSAYLLHLEGIHREKGQDETTRLYQAQLELSNIAGIDLQLLEDPGAIRKVVFHLEDRQDVVDACRPLLQSLGYEYVRLPISKGTDVASPQYWIDATQAYRGDARPTIMRGIFDLHLGEGIKGNGVQAADRSARLFGEGIIAGPSLDLVFTTLHQDSARELGLAHPAATIAVRQKDTTRDLGSQIEKALEDFNKGKLAPLSTSGW